MFNILNASLNSVLFDLRLVGCAFLCLTWLYGLFVRTLISLTNANAGCGRPTLNFTERFAMVHSVPTAKGGMCALLA